MSKKLYVGNLPYNTSEEAVRQAFAAIGEVSSVRLITDETGKMKGFGFVEMTTDEDAQKAITSLNGTVLMGRNVIVSEARPQTERSRGGGGPRGRQAGKPFKRGRESGKWR